MSKDMLRDIDLINVMTEEFRFVCMPIFIKSQKDKTGIQSIGTGFIVNYKNELYFITAAHVIDAIKYEKFAITLINKKAFDIKTDFQFKNFYEDDISIALISMNWLIIEHNMTTIPRIDLDMNFKGYQPLLYSSTLLIGYPSTKNILSSRYEKFNHFVSGIGLYTRKDTSNSKTQLPNPVIYEYNTKNILNSNGDSKINPHKLNGMSGSPMLQLYYKKETNSLQIKLEGIFLEFHKKYNEIIGTNGNQLKNILAKL